MAFRGKPNFHKDPVLWSGTLNIAESSRILFWLSDRNPKPKV